MREIKFRYVFRRKEDGHIWMLIVPIEAIEHGSSQLTSMLNDELWELISRDQFTGLKDKNGVELYEGDVIKAGQDIVLVMWSEKHASFCLHRIGWAFFHFFAEAVEAHRCEVIGNMHHNKDLLK